MYYDDKNYSTNYFVAYVVYPNTGFITWRNANEKNKKTAFNSTDCIYSI